MKSLEENGVAPVMTNAVRKETDDDMQVSFGSTAESEIIDELKALDVNTLTPIEAMSKLYEISAKAKQS